MFFLYLNLTRLKNMIVLIKTIDKRYHKMIKKINRNYLLYHKMIKKINRNYLLFSIFLSINGTLLY